jgi:hypothetical protein
MFKVNEVKKMFIKGKKLRTLMSYLTLTIFGISVEKKNVEIVAFIALKILSVNFNGFFVSIKLFLNFVIFHTSLNKIMICLY